MERHQERRPKELPYSEQVTKIILCAEGNSRRNGRTIITPGDVLVAITIEGVALKGEFSDPEIAEIQDILGGNVEFLKNHKDLAALEVEFSPRFKWVLEFANIEGHKSGKKELTPYLLVKSIIREGQREHQEEAT